MRINIIIILLLNFHLDTFSQSSIIYDVNDFVNPALTTGKILIPNSDSTIRISKIASTFFGLGSSVASVTRHLNPDSSSIVLWFNRSVFINKHQINFKLEYSNALGKTRFTSADTSRKFSYNLKPKIQYGYYFFTKNSSKSSLAYRIEGSLIPQIINSKFYPEIEIDYNGRINSVLGFNSLSNYFFVYSPREKKFAYGISSLAPVYYSEYTFINTVKIQFNYWRANRNGIDKSDILNLGILSEINIGLSSLYTSLNYENNYNLKYHAFTFSLFFLLHVNTKVHYLKGGRKNSV